MARVSIAFVICILASAVVAQESHMDLYHADPRYDAWIKSLMRPDTKTSCCSLNDCVVTTAEQRNGVWWVNVRGHWREVPPDKVVQTPLSIDGEAWVCANPNGKPQVAAIYCFIPPIPGY